MAEREPLDVLAIGAHPDDVEITSGGLLIGMARQGRRVGVLDLTEGEMGTYGDEVDRAAEAAAAGEKMGLVYRHNLGLPDAAVESNQANKLKLAQIIRDTQAELVVLPHWEQRHPDHLACSRLGYDACYLAGLAKAKLSGEPHRPRKIIYASYYREPDYSFLVDISDAFNQKMAAIAAYESQFGGTLAVERMRQRGFKPPEPDDPINKDIFAPGVSIYDFLYARSRALGQQAGVMYAEAYTVKEKILIDDPQTMPVNSI